jgi:hypothetical protein
VVVAHHVGKHTQRAHHLVEEGETKEVPEQEQPNQGLRAASKRVVGSGTE